jgi:hypothetical protein
VSGGTHDHATSSPRLLRLRDSHPLRSPVPAVFDCRPGSNEVPAGSSSRLVQPSLRSGGSLVRKVSLGSSRFARRYYGNPFCSSGYVRCFSSPGAPRHASVVGLPFPAGVAPFGDLRITDCQRLPGAFRRVAASFIGLMRLGIHHVPFCGSSPHQRCNVLVLRGARGDAWRRRDTCRPRGSASSLLKVHHNRRGAAGTRTPDLRRARAALSQLSYGPLPEYGSPPREVGAPGLEPGTSALSGPRSNQLSYAPVGRDCPAHQPSPALCRRRSSAIPKGRPTAIARSRSWSARVSPARRRPCRAIWRVAAPTRPEARSPAGPLHRAVP